MTLNRWSEVVLVTCLLRLVSSQTLYGPNYCLLPRLDVVPCVNYYPFLPTPDPSDNEFSIYQTAFARGPAGLPICYPTGPPENVPGVQDIASIGDLGQVKFLISPGIELENPELYGNQELVTYNVTCPDDHIAFFNITFADMEPPTCLGRCVDYLTVDRSPFGTSETCGNDTDANFEQLDLGSFVARFRTSPADRRSGFRATVICFKQEEQPEDCTMPDESGGVMVMNGETDPSGRRRKRDLDDFHLMWQRRLTYLKRVKRQSPDFILRYDKINVAHQVIVNFTDKTLVFTDTRTNEELQKVEGILFLHTFDAAGNVDEFREAGKDEEGRLIPFPGPGPLFIVGRHAYFQLFVIDPRGLLPNANESAVISMLTDGQFDAISLENTSLPENFLLPAEPVPEDIGLPPLRGKRQAQTGITYNDEVILTAIQFRNACNPVLRANAVATLQSADPADVERLGGTTTTTDGVGSGMGVTTPLAPI